MIYKVAAIEALGEEFSEIVVKILGSAVRRNICPSLHKLKCSLASYWVF